MKKLRNVMRKCMASLLVLCMAAAPCVTEIGSVFAEPDTDTDIEPVAYKVTLNDAQNGKVSFKDSEERTHSYKEGDKVALKVQEMIWIMSSRHFTSQSSAQQQKER